MKNFHSKPSSSPALRVLFHELQSAPIPPNAQSTTDESPNSPSDVQRQPPSLLSNPRDAAILAAKTVAHAAAAVAPLADLQPIIEGGLIPPTGPRVEYESGTRSLPLAIHYEGSCRPPRFSHTSFTGSLNGTAYIAVSAFDLTTTNLTIADSTVSASLAGSHIISDSSIQVLVRANFTLHDGLLLRGNFKAALTNQPGILFITEADLQLGHPSELAVFITLTNVSLSELDSGGLSPFSGSSAVSYLDQNSELIVQPITFSH